MYDELRGYKRRSSTMQGVRCGSVHAAMRVNTEYAHELNTTLYACTVLCSMACSWTCVAAAPYPMLQHGNVLSPITHIFRYSLSSGLSNAQSDGHCRADERHLTSWRADGQNEWWVSIALSALHVYSQCAGDSSEDLGDLFAPVLQRPEMALLRTGAE